MRKAVFMIGSLVLAQARALMNVGGGAGLIALRRELYFSHVLVLNHTFRVR